MRRIALLALFVPTLALASETTLTHQGRLVDADGTPLNGQLPVLVRIMDAPNIGEGSASVTASQTVTFRDGYFQLNLESVTAEDVAGDRWLSVTIDGSELSREPLHSVPYAVRSSSVTLSDSTAICNATTTNLHGTLRFHNDGFEGCTSEGWVELAMPLPFEASGGSVAEVGGYRIHTFTSSSTFSVGPVAGEVDVLVVAGGGGGGGRSGGGGGAGGVLLTESYTVNLGQNYTVTIGNGGGGGGGGGSFGGGGNGSRGSTGQNSAFGSLVAFGGGGGGSDNGNTGASGGSGGGGRYNNVGGSGVSGQGFAGGFGWGNPYAGGGGGGAGGPGVAGTSGGEIGDGGPGRLINISGAPTYYGGGGGGGSHNPANGFGYGGSGGGGNGGAPGGYNSGTAGVANTGGGGGAGSTISGSGGAGGSGGSGIVIVRYPIQ